MRNGICSICKSQVEESRKKHAYCKPCFNAYTRKRRVKHKDLPEDQRKKANCRAYSKEYLKRGKIKRTGCIICGEKAEMHHEDYNKPLEITWLCRKHHIEHHAKIKGDYKPCRKCGEKIHRDSYCKKCHNEYMRVNRLKHYEIPEERRKIINCRAYLRVYLKRGKVVRGVCNCGNSSTQAIHEDYSKPLEVKWVCKDCKPT